MKYFVLSRGENPVQLFFDIKTAQRAGEDIYDGYLDIFDESGHKLETLKLVSNGFKKWWTSDF